MICIYGKSASGKDLFSKILIELYPQLHRSIRPTTRPKRKNDDSLYDYYTDEEFLKDENICFKTQFRNWWYGVYHNQVLDSLAVLSIDGKTANKIKEKYPNTILIEIRADNEVRLKRSLLRENGENIGEINRRMKADEVDYKNLKFKPDFIINNNIDEIGNKMLRNEAKRIGGLILNG